MFHTRALRHWRRGGENCIGMKNKSIVVNQKALARDLYLRDIYTQKQICNDIGIAEKTMCDWIKKEKWDDLKNSLVTSKAEQLKALYEQMAYVNKRNKDAIEDDDPATNPIYDDVAKISKSIERLEKEAGISEMLQTGIAFLKYMQNEDTEAAKVISKWFYIFMQDKMGETK